MEDVMETCYLDSVTMCARGYKCETCTRHARYIEKAGGTNGRSNTSRDITMDSIDSANNI